MSEAELAALAVRICPNAPLDLGIVRAVDILRKAGVYTVESCEGGEGHAYPHPTVRINGSHGEGWKALAVCMDHGLPVVEMRRTWTLNHGEVDGPVWDIVFREKLCG